MEQFLGAVERVEADSPPTEGRRLSARMRESWDTGRFWFNSAARSSLDIDTIYWNIFLDSTVEVGNGLLDGSDDFVDMKMKQLGAYLREKEKDSRCS